MARTYAYCVGDAPRPVELRLSAEIDKLGVYAVTGSEIISAREVRDMHMAENVSRIYQEREHAEDWSDWAAKNQDSVKILDMALKEYKVWVEDKIWLKP